MGVDALDMPLEDVIQKQKGGSKGRSKGSSKGSAKGRLWGGAAKSALGRGATNGAAGKRVPKGDKLDMSLEDVVQADIDSKRRPKGEGRTKGKGVGKSRSIGSPRDYGGKGRNGYSSKGKGKGYDRERYAPVSKGRSKGYKDYDGDRAAKSWSQHDDWRADEDDEDEDDYRRPVASRGGSTIRGLMRQAGRRGGRGGDDDSWGSGRANNLLGKILGAGSRVGRTVTSGGSGGGSYGDRLGGDRGWATVAQDVDDDDSPPPRRRLGAGMAARATREAAGRRTATSAREKALRDEKPATRRRAQESPEPPRRRAREEAPAPAAKRRKEETTKASRRIKITNVAKDLDDQDIKEAFEAETGKILECKLNSKGTAFITFAKASDAVKAVETFDRGELNGKQISVTIYEG